MIRIAVLVTGMLLAQLSSSAASLNAPRPGTQAELPKPIETRKPESPPGAQVSPPVDLNFDLLDPPEKKALPAAALAPPVDEGAIRMRRTMLTVHQALGLALVAGEAGAVVTGQLNFNDKFLGSNSGRYQTLHKAFVYPTLGLAAVTAGLGIFAPASPRTSGSGFDRMTLHRIGQYTAFAGWAAELVLGLLTVFHEGFANQPAFAAAHLGVGYVTLAGLSLGVSAITF